MTNIAYLRVSHTESLNGTSLEVQESKCRALTQWVWEAIPIMVKEKAHLQL